MYISPKTQARFGSVFSRLPGDRYAGSHLFKTAENAFFFQTKPFFPENEIGI